MQKPQKQQLLDEIKTLASTKDGTDFALDYVVSKFDADWTNLKYNLLAEKTPDELLHIVLLKIHEPMRERIGEFFKETNTNSDCLAKVIIALEYEGGEAADHSEFDHATDILTDEDWVNIFMDGVASYNLPQLQEVEAQLRYHGPGHYKYLRDYEEEAASKTAPKTAPVVAAVKPEEEEEEFNDQNSVTVDVPTGVNHIDLLEEFKQFGPIQDFDFDQKNKIITFWFKDRRDADEAIAKLEDKYTILPLTAYV